MPSTSIDCASTYEIDGITIFERDCTAEIEYTANRYDVEWEVTELLFEERNWSTDPETGEKVWTTGYASLKKDHPLFEHFMAGIDRDWLQNAIIEKEELMLERESDEWGADYRASVL